MIPKKCPLYGRFTGVEKNFIRQFQVCGHIELEVCEFDNRLRDYFRQEVLVSMRLITKDWLIFKIEFGSKTILGVQFFGFFTSKKLPPYGTSHRCRKILISQCRVCDISGVPITSNHRNWNPTVNLRFLWDILCEKWSDRQFDVE